MKKQNVLWTIADLQKNYETIEFPEFQREPTVWDLGKKRKLIDSILRQFDISSIYLHKRPDGYFDCIDGRQRINAILSFLGLNETWEEVTDSSNYHNEFKFTVTSDGLLTDELDRYNDKTFKDMENEGCGAAILDYQFNVLDGIDKLDIEFLQPDRAPPSRS